MIERYMVDDAGTLIDMQTRDTYDYVSEICPVLNTLIKNNQYEEFKKWFLKKEFKIKRDTTWIDPQVIFRYFEIEQEETQTLDQLQKICNKYDIPFNDLPEVLEEYIATDNEEYLEKIRSQRK